MTDLDLSLPPPPPTAAYLRACASAVHWRFERKGHKGRHRNRLWLLHRGERQARFKTLRGAEQFIAGELETCYAYQRISEILQTILQDPDHEAYEAVLAWSKEGPSARSDGAVKKFWDPYTFVTRPEVTCPAYWTADDLKDLVPRAHTEECLVAYMERLRCAGFEQVLAKDMEALVPTAPRTGRRRL